jgi:hypothetical protein
VRIVSGESSAIAAASRKLYTSLIMPLHKYTTLGGTITMQDPDERSIDIGPL